MPTAVSRLSKPDTVFLCEPAGAGAAALATDVSQYRTALTNNTTYVSEANSARVALTAPREVSLVVDLDDTDEATLIEHGDGLGDFTFQVSVTAGGFVRCSENGSAVVSGTLPGVDGTVRRFLIAWSTREESTGNARSELLLVRLDTEAVEFAVADHTVATTDPTWTLVVNGDSTGAGGLADLTRYRTVRVGRRFHSATEAWEDHVSETTPPAVTMVRRDAPLVPDRATLDLADDGAFAGPAYLMAGATFRDCDRRLVGAVVNARVPDPIDITTAYEPEAWWRLAPGSSTLRMCIAHLWYVPIPGKSTHLRARLFVHQACAVDTETAEVRYRVYAIAGWSFAGEAPKPLTYYRTAEATCDVDHDAGEGEWLDLGAVQIARDDWDCTALAVAVEIDEDSPLAPDTTARILAVTLEPYAVDGEDDGLPFQNA